MLFWWNTFFFPVLNACVWLNHITFCFYLFVCFTTPKVGDYFVFKSHKWVRFSFFVCFVLCCFSFKVFDFPTTYLGSGWFYFILFYFILFYLFIYFFFWSRRLVKFFAFFHFCLFLFYFVLFFCFVFLLPKIPPPPPPISNGAPLSSFYYTDDGAHYVIDNFGLPCNSVKK